MARQSAALVTQRPVDLRLTLPRRTTSLRRCTRLVADLPQPPGRRPWFHLGTGRSGVKSAPFLAALRSSLRSGAETEEGAQAIARLQEAFIATFVEDWSVDR